MLGGYVNRLVARMMRRTAVLGVGALCVLVGVGFLTIALWLHLSLLYGAVLASLVIGAAFLGVGLILAGSRALRPVPRAQPTSDPEPHPEAPVFDNSDAPPLMQAFLYGMQAGMKARQS